MHQYGRLTFLSDVLRSIASSLSHFVSISNYIRGKVSGLAWKERGTSLMWIWIWSRISPPISYPRLSRVARLQDERFSDFLNALLGDRTVSDLSRVLISRLSDIQSNMRESLLRIP